MTTGSEHKIAFALGGLAGNNAHGAGFLQAALDAGVRPQHISCTSGQIRWVYHYLLDLLAREAGEAGNGLKAEFRQELAELMPTGNINLNLLQLAVNGRPGIFKMAYDKLLPDWLVNSAQLFRELLAKPQQMPVAKLVMGQWPARTLEPLTDEARFEAIARLFNDPAHGIGISFNAYNPVLGKEYVYRNAAALKAWKARKPHHPERYDHGNANPHRKSRVYQDITAEALRDALWLYQYGFDKPGLPFVDGAYYRDIMLAELTPAQLIFVVRPLNSKWLGALPSNYLEVEDMKTEVAFNGAYAAERQQIELINHLLADQRLTPEACVHRHPIQLEPVEVRMQRDYFDYIFESQAVFDDGYGQARTRFGQLGLGGTAGAVAPTAPTPAKKPTLRPLTGGKASGAAPATGA